jgi:hypothetical protein
MTVARTGSDTRAGTGGASGGVTAHTTGTGGASSDSGARDATTSDANKGAGRAIDHDAAAAEDSGAVHDSDAECASIAVDVCNPVTNDGCLDSLSMQCAVDRASTLAGYCIFYSGDSGQSPSDGGDCLNTGITESCPPTFTCLDSRCRKLCLCAADCETGQCCKEALESTGFKVCGEC